MKIEIKLSPEEFREVLPDKLKEMFDSLVKNLVQNGMNEKEAKGIVANLMLNAIKKMGSEQQ